MRPQDREDVNKYLDEKYPEKKMTRLSMEEKHFQHEEQKKILKQDFKDLFTKHNKILKQPYVLKYIEEFIKEMNENGAWAKE